MEQNESRLPRCFFSDPYLARREVVFGCFHSTDLPLFGRSCAFREAAFRRQAPPLSSFIRVFSKAAGAMRQDACRELPATR